MVADPQGEFIQHRDWCELWLGYLTCGAAPGDECTCDYWERTEGNMQTPHERWVAKGKCASTSRTKSWCNLRMNHTGPHGAPLLLDGGGERWLSWKNDQEFPH